MAPASHDTLERSVAFIAKRDGIDKVLKLMRYSVKLACVSAFKDSDSELANQLRGFESSLGTTRKALKLGKFLKDVDALRKVSRRKPFWQLELVSYSGEVVYLWLEQVTWLIKAGLVAKRYSLRVSKLSAAAELFGYTGSLALSSMQLLLSYEAEGTLQIQIQGAENDGEKDIKALRQELSALRFKRQLRILAIVQDFADAMLAAVDLRGGKGRFSNPIFLSVLGLVSAAISAHKNWPR